MQNGAAHNSCGLPVELSNFQGNHKCAPSVALGRPRDYEQLARLITTYPAAKAAGVGHSWWAGQMCAGHNRSAVGLVTTEFDFLLNAVASGSLSSIITVDEEAMTATAPAGLTQRALLEYLAAFRSDNAPAGYTLAAFSWFIDQTLGGAVSTGSHGSSLQHGSLSRQVTAIKWMDAGGAIHTSTPRSDPHLWRALAVSVGRLGVLLEISFVIVPNRSVTRRKEDLIIDEMLGRLQALQDGYNAAKRTGASPAALWEVLKPWEQAQIFWHIPLRTCWLLTFTRSDNATSWVPPVSAMDGPLPGGAYEQQAVRPVGVAPGTEQGAVYWAGLYATWLGVNVQPETLPARQAYLSMSELENVMAAPYTSYDQYEVGIPLSRAADCLTKLSARITRDGLWRGFRTPPLIRFVSAEPFYLSVSNGPDPVLYMNLEDHVSYATRRPNTEFQTVMDVLRRDPACRGRMHWGKAGWEVHARCFDGAAEIGSDWCRFGCVATGVDPNSKFASDSDVWAWFAAERSTGTRVQDFRSCCSTPAAGGAADFDSERCVCARRPPCST